MQSLANLVLGVYGKLNYPVDFYYSDNQCNLYLFNREINDFNDYNSFLKYKLSDEKILKENVNSFEEALEIIKEYLANEIFK